MATINEIKAQHEEDQQVIIGHANTDWDECYLDAHQHRGDLLIMVDKLESKLRAYGVVADIESL